MRSGVFHGMLLASGLAAILLSAQVSAADHLATMGALADALPRQDELPRGSEWQQPKEQQQGNADSDLFVSRSWQGRKPRALGAAQDHVHGDGGRGWPDGATV